MRGLPGFGSVRFEAGDERANRVASSSLIPYSAKDPCHPKTITSTRIGSPRWNRPAAPMGDNQRGSSSTLQRPPAQIGNRPNATPHPATRNVFPHPRPLSRWERGVTGRFPEGVWRETVFTTTAAPPRFESHRPSPLGRAQGGFRLPPRG